MLVSAEIDRNNGVVRTTASGLLTKADRIAHIETIWCDRSIANFDEIVDARDADVSALTAADLAAIVNSGVVYDPASDPRLALCVDSELAFGLARLDEPDGELTERRYRPRSSGTGGMPTNVSKLPSIASQLCASSVKIFIEG